jgi:hypothetical protein
MDAEALGDDIVRIQRRARFADTTTEEWARRLERLIADQTGITRVVVSNVRQVGAAAGGSNGTLLFDAAYQSSDGVERRPLVLRFLPMQGLFHTYDVGRSSSFSGRSHTAACLSLDRCGSTRKGGSWTGLGTSWLRLAASAPR